jgi:hypothetical protein
MRDLAEAVILADDMNKKTGDKPVPAKLEMHEDLM